MRANKEDHVELDNKELDDAEIARSMRLRFSIWDLLAMTSFNAVLFAMPVEAIGFVVSAALVGTLLLGYFVFDAMFFVSKRLQRSRAMRFFSTLINRGFLYSLCTLLVGAVAFWMKCMF